jgi:hypothetical protein
VALAAPKLKLPNSPEQIAFRLVEQILRSDPLLSTTMRTLRCWQGDSSDIQGPTFATCPFVRLSPSPEASARRTEIQHQMPLDVGIEVAVAGTDYDQLANFWGAVRSAIFPIVEPRRTAVLTMSNTAKVTRSQMIMNGYRWKPEGEGIRLLYAQGTLQLILLVQTM